MQKATLQNWRVALWCNSHAQARPSTYATTAKLEPYHHQAQIRSVRSGFDPQSKPLPLPSLLVSRIFARFAALRQSPPIAKTKILTFLQLFFDYGLSSIPAKRKKGRFTTVYCIF